MILVGADSGGHCDSSWGRACPLPGQAGKWTRCSSAEHRAKIIHPLLHAELKITNHVIRGGSWCGLTEWMLKARKVMPKFLITWAYHVQWLLLAHEIEPFSLLSAFPPQLGPQVAFFSVWKEDSYSHLSEEFIKTQNTWPFKQGEVSGWRFDLWWMCYRAPQRMWYVKHLLGHRALYYLQQDKRDSFIAKDLQYSKAHGKDS